MKNHLIQGSAAGLCLVAILAGTAVAQPVNRVSANEKGSIVIFPKVEIRWDANGNLVQDTFLDLTNDYPDDVMVQLYFVNGDPPQGVGEVFTDARQPAAQAGRTAPKPTGGDTPAEPLTFDAVQMTNLGVDREVVFDGHVLTDDRSLAPGILYAPSEEDDPAYRAAISDACGGITVDYFDARVATPDLSLLQNYHCVMTWANFSYFDQVAFGDVLADYVDQGGRVVLGAFTTYTVGNYLAGRIMEPGYSPVISPTGQNAYADSAYAGDGMSCIHADVTDYACVFRDLVALQGNGIQDGSYLDGEIAAAYRPDYQVVFLNGAGGYPVACAGEDPQRVCNACACESHPGWNWVDNVIGLTGNEPTYWSVLTGYPKGVSPFTVLDSTDPPGRLDPDGSTDRVLRGFVIAWAVNSSGEEINWNHLKGDALLVNYRDGSAWEYNAVTYQALSGSHGGVTDALPGELRMDGTEYDENFALLLLDFYASGQSGFSGGGFQVLSDTDLTLLPLGVDLRQDGDGPRVTKAKFDVWNMNEFKFSGTERCVSCWDQTLLSLYADPNHFLRENLRTDKGKARIDGLGSAVCPGSQASPLVAVSMKMLDYFADSALIDVGRAGSNVPGMGTDKDASILADSAMVPPPTMPGEAVREGRIGGTSVPQR